MTEHTPTLHHQMFTMLADYRLCDILKTIDVVLDRTASARTEEQKVVLQEIQHHLEPVILQAEKIDFFVAE